MCVNSPSIENVDSQWMLLELLELPYRGTRGLFEHDMANGLMFTSV